MKKFAAGRAGLVLSMLIFGTIGVVRKNCTVSSSMLAMLRGFIGAAVLVLFMLAARKKINFAEIKKNIVFLAVSGAFIGFNWILLFEAYRYTTVAVATVCYYMAPVFIMIASPFLLKEKLGAKKLICIAVALCGMVCVSGITGGAGDYRGVLLGLGAAVLYAGVVIMNKKNGGMSAYEKTIGQLFFAAAVLVPYNLIKGEFGQLSSTGASNIAVIAVLGCVHTGLAYLLYFGSIENVGAQSAAILSYIDPATAVLLSFVFLSERVSFVETAGIILIIVSALVSEIRIGGEKNERKA